MLKLWKVTHKDLPRPIYLKAASENDAKITFMNNFFGTLSAEKFVIDPSFRIDGASFDDLPDQFTADLCLYFDF